MIGEEFFLFRSAFLSRREFPAGSTVKFTDFVEAAEGLWKTFSSAGAPGGMKSTAIQTGLNL